MLRALIEPLLQRRLLLLIGGEVALGVLQLLGQRGHLALQLFRLRRALLQAVLENGLLLFQGGGVGLGSFELFRGRRQVRLALGERAIHLLQLPAPPALSLRELVLRKPQMLLQFPVGSLGALRLGERRLLIFAAGLELRINLSELDVPLIPLL